MNDYRKLTKTHRDIALQFLYEANYNSEKPLETSIIEQVYDLFADEKSGSIGYQRSLSKILEREN